MRSTAKLPIVLSTLILAACAGSPTDARLGEAGPSVDVLVEEPSLEAEIQSDSTSDRTGGMFGSGT